MFTGIITDIGTVRAAEQRGDLRLTIGCGYDMDTVAMGASIACSGVCLTVVDKGDDWFAVDLSAESVGRTAPGMWQEGRRLNLERAMRLGDELGGHLVTGHVDGIGTVRAVASEGDSTRIEFEAPAAIGRYIAQKGSICVDGVSLTVNHVADKTAFTRFGINLIPHSANHTTLGSLELNQPVNLEIDVIARYLDRMSHAPV